MQIQADTSYGTATVNIPLAAMREQGIEIMGYEYSYSFLAISAFVGSVAFAAAYVFKYKPILTGMTGIAVGTYVAASIYPPKNIQEND